MQETQNGTKKYRWVLKDVAHASAVPMLARQLNDLPEALARALVLRGITTFDEARRYFRPSKETLHDPFLMQDMDAAADRVGQAIQRGERVLVYGDYDVDGTTSTALMTSFLRSQGVPADFFIPDRFKHGYGLSKAGIDHAKTQGAKLIIALDCGITAIDEAAYARSLGIDLIICDHHTAGETWPDAVAVLDPKRPDCNYPFNELSGCGVTFKLVQATLRRLGQDPESASQYLDLVAVSTASDLVPLVGENRVLMREGFVQLKEGARIGLRALAKQGGVDYDHVTVDRIVFAIGPRINAAGRMEHARQAVELLLADDMATAQHLAQELERVNNDRRKLDREICDDALDKAKIQMGGRFRHALVLHEPGWHQGVIGIVASRVVDRYHRPAVMLCTANGAAKGSARSIPGVNIYKALKQCDDLITQFGGHDFAAGLTLPEANVPALRDRLDRVIETMVQDPDLLLPSIDIDAQVALHDIDDRFWAVLKQFGPFGPENMKPVFQADGLRVVGRPRTVGSGAHLKFKVAQNGSAAHDVIGFRLGKHLPTVEASQREGRPLDLLFSVEENEWQGRVSLQLVARDLRLAKHGP